MCVHKCGVCHCVHIMDMDLDQCTNVVLFPQNGTVTVVEFHQEIQSVTNHPLKEFIIPFLKVLHYCVCEAERGVGGRKEWVQREGREGNGRKERVAEGREGDCELGIDCISPLVGCKGREWNALPFPLFLLQA